MALACLALPSAHADPVTQDDVDRAKEAEASTSASIGELEAQLAQLNVDLETAQRNAQIANEDYLMAVQDLATASSEAQTAQESADSAAQETRTARADLGAVVVQTYQEGGSAITALTPYVTATSMSELADADVARARMGELTNAKVQDVEALQAVAETMQGIADEKVETKQTAATEAETAKADAASAATTAQTEVAQAQAQRDALVTRLAEQRGTTVELEKQHQDQLEAERKAREEAAAKAAAEEAARTAAQQAPQEPPSQAAEDQPAAEEAAPQAQEPETEQPAPATEGAEEAEEPEEAPQEAPAPQPAPAVEEEAEEPAPAPAASGDAASVAIASAMNYIGTPYVWGGESAAGLDCSGLTMMAYQAAGISLTHSSRVQYGQGAHVPLSSAQPGDLVFWSSDGTQSGIYHVAIYLGDGQMIEAPTFGFTVTVTSMRYSGAMPTAVRPY
ncbi:C40 family peptidase [Actinomyces bowdenii]|uniref:NlpC/P60 family protein n=1 Tax=Actinomyces bowdenii TaxID=131109 RepID=A0A3P1V9W2_9ACTO|nr:C40 family peptidase [Actinomyces bowdenii]MBO3723679.1 C40 family peptidase [Actinomyces bowdenii]RRD31012.1 NlpC/P60 family protein [Actinomyces bowdenii]